MAVHSLEAQHAMSWKRRITIVFAGIVTAPGVILATAACAYIAWSLATERWYRNWFLDYGVTLLALYALFTAGVVALAMLALGRVERRRVAIALAVAGFAAACGLEFELSDEGERLLPFGLLFGPYVAWGLAWALLRLLPPEPRTPDLAAQWEDTRH